MKVSELTSADVFRQASDPLEEAMNLFKDEDFMAFMFNNMQALAHVPKTVHDYLSKK